MVKVIYMTIKLLDSIPCPENIKSLSGGGGGSGVTIAEQYTGSKFIANIC